MKIHLKRVAFDRHTPAILDHQWDLPWIKRVLGTNLTLALIHCDDDVRRHFTKAHREYAAAHHIPITDFENNPSCFFIQGMTGKIFAEIANYNPSSRDWCPNDIQSYENAKVIVKRTEEISVVQHDASGNLSLATDDEIVQSVSFRGGARGRSGFGGRRGSGATRGQTRGYQAYQSQKADSYQDNAMQAANGKIHMTFPKLPLHPAGRQLMQAHQNLQVAARISKTGAAVSKEILSGKEYENINVLQPIFPGIRPVNVATFLPDHPLDQLIYYISEAVGPEDVAAGLVAPPNERKPKRNYATNLPDIREPERKEATNLPDTCKPEKRKIINLPTTCETGKKEIIHLPITCEPEKKKTIIHLPNTYTPEKKTEKIKYLQHETITTYLPDTCEPEKEKETMSLNKIPDKNENENESEKWSERNDKMYSNFKNLKYSNKTNQKLIANRSCYYTVPAIYSFGGKTDSYELYQVDEISCIKIKYKPCKKIISNRFSTLKTEDGKISIKRSKVKHMRLSKTKHRRAKIIHPLRVDDPEWYTPENRLNPHRKIKVRDTNQIQTIKYKLNVMKKKRTNNYKKKPRNGKGGLGNKVMNAGKKAKKLKENYGKV